MRTSKTIVVLLLTLGLIGFVGSTSVVMADQTDPPHKTHLDDLRGPGMGGGGSPCTNCHTSGSPGQGDVDFDVCHTCHSANGPYDGVNDPYVGALNNWENIDSPASATQSLIYNADGTLMCGKDKWCAACHDLETGLNLIDDFESYADNASFQNEWTGTKDVESVDLKQSRYVINMEPWGQGQCMNVKLDWSIDPDKNWGKVKREFSTPLDLTDRTHFNFYLKLEDRTEVSKITVTLKKTDGTACKADVTTGAPQGFVNEVWRLVSLPRASFDVPDWEQVNLISIAFYEQNPDQSGTTWARIDEIGCDVTGPDVIGDNVSSGYYVTGHKIMYCSRCHDLSSEHIDFNRLPFIDYIQDTDNPTGFRFYSDADMQIALPHPSSQPYDSDNHALCYKCHEESWLTEDAEFDPNPDLMTNFREDNDYMPWTNQHNLHRYHLMGSGGNASCVLCHDPHGQWNPAMNREENGDLVYADGSWSQIPDRATDRNGNGIPDWFDPEDDVNRYGLMTVTQWDDTFCTACHTDLVGSDTYYYRTYKVLPHTGGMEAGPDCFTSSCHTVSQDHATHFDSVKGPCLPLNETGCYYCHADGHLQCADAALFKNVEDPEGLPQYLSDTTVCDSCHSRGGP